MHCIILESFYEIVLVLFRLTMEQDCDKIKVSFCFVEKNQNNTKINFHFQGAFELKANMDGVFKA